MMWSAWLMDQGVMEARWGTYCSFSRHVWWADPESLTEAVMMFPGRSKQFLHCGCDCAGWEQQPTSLLPTWGTRAHVQTETHNTSDTAVCSGHDQQYLWKKGRSTITGHHKWLLDGGLWIRSAGHWSNFPGGELDMLSNLRLIAMALCYWRSFIQFFVL